MASRKRKKIGKEIVVTFLLVAVVSVIAYYATRSIFKPNFIRYPGFGIDMPVNYEIHGIDVSRHQDRIDWDEVREMEDSGIKLGFAFIKATEGLQSIDPKFRRNWEEARLAQIPRGAYHFFNPGKSGVLQAIHFAEQVQFQPGDLPPVLDIEQAGRMKIPDLQKEAAAFLETIEKYYKVRPIIYTNVVFYNTYLGEKFDAYPLWVAHYLVKDKPRITRPWTFWQHNETGKVNGIRSSVDFNVFSGDSAAFRALLIR